ncbi:MAG TPA: BamA/TamA family outer membrane protein, partial [Burkholderiales bacterium]|nr:BamA/TamA family outer membrane protein [Burkholderiales bacterium]
SSVDAAEADTAAYNTKSVGAGMFFGIPLSEDRRLNIGGDVERIRIETHSTTAQIAQEFVARHGFENTLYKLTVGWSDDTLDNLLAPRTGSLQRLSGEITLPGSDIEYYKINYLAGRYWALSESVSVKLKGELGYGDGLGDTGELPFYKNFFAGGSGTVRGYESRSLGPRDALPPNDPTGGNRRVLLNTELLFPVPGAKVDKSTRFALFIDGGMVYGPGEKLDLGELRYAAGLAFNWYSPVGPLSFSLAKPLNDKPGDQTESFQFTLGVPLR